MIKPKRERTCPHCKEKYRPFNTFQKHCLENECILKANEKKKKKQYREAVKKFKAEDKAHLKKIAQQVFNKYIRHRDGNICITCGATNRQIHAGHYRPVGRNGKLRFNEQNCHSQCSICNNHLSGNLVAYREAMIDIYGLIAVELLEADNEPYSYTVDELKEIIDTYKRKYKEL